MDTHATLPAPPAPARTSNPIARAFRAPFELRTWRETFHLLLNLPVGIVTFTVVVTAFATGVGLLFAALVGIPVLFVAMYVSRAMGTFERLRAKALLDLEVPPPYRPDPAPDRWWRVHVARFTDPATWIEVGYHLLMLPIGILTFTLAVTFWALGIGLVTLPIYGWSLPEPASFFGDSATQRWVIDTPVEHGLAALLGVLILLATPWIVRGVATANRYLVRGMLGTDVIARVQALIQTRAAAVDLAAEDRRRIERDLHDGVQQRLVALAMELGRAKEKLDTDPEGAKELVTQAHEEAKRAITEVRDLARGIYPAVLTDRGLDAALSALASRSPVPVDVSVQLSRRPPASVEAAAYFLVSEALSNVAKHSRATSAQVTVRLSGDGWLTIQVRDDGIGGADPSGAGLAGLRDRVRALDGELRLLSPVGGPTVLMAEIPCAS